MYYNDNIISPTPRRHKAVINGFNRLINPDADDSILELSDGRYYNLKADSGALKENYGTEILKNNDGTSIALSGGEIRNCYRYSRFDEISGSFEDFVAVLYENGNFYLYSLTNNTSYNLGTLNGNPKAVQYRLNGDDVLILTSKEDNMLVLNGNTLTAIDNAPDITSMCVHYERLFCTVSGRKSAVWFSDDLDPTNWNITLEEAGFIEFADEGGALNKVISFSDYVYAFRTYGITRISAYGDQRDFYARNLFVSSGRIFSDTVAVCGDKVMFLSGDGIYRFDGLDTVNVTKNSTSLFSKIDNSAATAAYYNGKYYLSCKLNIEDVIKDCVIIYDFVKGNYSIITDENIKVFINFNTENKYYLLAVLKNDNKILSVNESGNYKTKQWLSPESDFNAPESIKIIREIYILTETSCVLNVKYDGGTKSFQLIGANYPQKIKTALKGKNFSFTIKSSSASVKIARPVIIYESF